MRPTITYLDQTVPPAVDMMPPYHLHPHDNVDMFEPSPMLPSYINSHNHSSGVCLDAYAQRFEISQVVSPFRKIILHQRRESTEHEFKFQHEDDVRAMYNSCFPDMLDKNRRLQNGNQYSFYKWIAEFPH